ncbi:SDR family NAD(P)-dependent oxidoreductase [Deinococcus sp.]|uniref:SDR family NAD(P)-dependent oxidoreductase n=1 Tax=Deinococcus sp. TaxID=47478 RepID=UPI003C7B6694
MNSTVTRVTVITGAAQGIGRRTAKLCAGRGDALILTGDLSDEGVVSHTAAILERWGRVDALVNNAGISFITPAEETSAAGFRRVLEVNLTAPFLLCRELGKALLEQRAGSIVNVASVAGLLGISDRAAYNASKHRLIGLTRTLAAEWGGRNVRVNAVCHRRPGADGPVCHARRCGARDPVPQRQRCQHLRERRDPECGRRLGRRRELGNSTIGKTVSPVHPGRLAPGAQCGHDRSCTQTEFRRCRSQRRTGDQGLRGRRWAGTSGTAAQYGYGRR